MKTFYKITPVILLLITACDFSPVGLAGGRGTIQPASDWGRDSSSPQGLCSQGQMKINDHSLISSDCASFPGYCEYAETPLTGISLENNQTLSLSVTFNAVKGSYPTISALEYRTAGGPFLILHFACMDQNMGNFSCIAPAAELAAGAGQSFYLSQLTFKSSLNDDTPLVYSDNWGPEASPCQLSNTTATRKIDAPVINIPHA